MNQKEAKMENIRENECRRRECDRDRTSRTALQITAGLLQTKVTEMSFQADLGRNAGGTDVYQDTDGSTTNPLPLASPLDRLATRAGSQTSKEAAKNTPQHANIIHTYIMDMFFYGGYMSEVVDPSIYVFLTYSPRAFGCCV